MNSVKFNEFKKKKLLMQSDGPYMTQAFWKLISDLVPMVHQLFSCSFFCKAENICKGVSISRGRVLRRRGMCQNLSLRVAHTRLELFFFKLV